MCCILKYRRLMGACANGQPQNRMSLFCLYRQCNDMIDIDKYFNQISDLKPVCTLKGGFSEYLIITKIACAGVRKFTFSLWQAKQNLLILWSWWSAYSEYYSCGCYFICCLTLYSIITPFDAFDISCVFENIMENRAFALLEQMLHFK